VTDLLHLTRISNIDIEGIMTHFAVADSTGDPFTATQIKLFKQVLKGLDREGVPYEMVHAANSAALINHAAACAFDAVRPGLMTYGVWPTDTAPEQSPLEPVLRWETSVVLLKDIAAGATVGYGRTYTAERPCRAAILPVGYADGYKYALGNNAEVLIRGKRCSVVGAVSMDQIVVDVTHVPGVAAGDKATLIGADGDETVTVKDLARQAKTIPYDILTGLGRRVARVYVE
jgi:alanine racemase